MERLIGFSATTAARGMRWKVLVHSLMGRLTPPGCITDIVMCAANPAFQCAKYDHDEKLTCLQCEIALIGSSACYHADVADKAQLMLSLFEEKFCSVRTRTTIQSYLVLHRISIPLRR